MARVLELCEALHFLDYIGWDIALTEDGFQIIEGNSHPNVRMPADPRDRCSPIPTYGASTRHMAWSVLPEQKLKSMAVLVTKPEQPSSPVSGDAEAVARGPPTIRRKARTPRCHSPRLRSILATEPPTLKVSTAAARSATSQAAEHSEPALLRLEWMEEAILS
jgi:hypothetical protein